MQCCGLIALGKERDFYFYFLLMSFDESLSSSLSSSLNDCHTFSMIMSLSSSLTHSLSVLVGCHCQPVELTSADWVYTLRICMFNVVHCYVRL